MKQKNGQRVNEINVAATTLMKLSFAGSPVRRLTGLRGASSMRADN